MCFTGGNTFCSPGHLVYTRILLKIDLNLIKRGVENAKRAADDARHFDERCPPRDFARRFSLLKAAVCWKSWWNLLIEHGTLF